VFGRNRIGEELTAGNPSETIAVCSDSGCITDTVFEEILCHVQDRVRSGHNNHVFASVG
jgi:hypothetical protein